MIDGHETSLSGDLVTWNDPVDAVARLTRACVQGTQKDQMDDRINRCAKSFAVSTDRHMRKSRSSGHLR